MKLEKLVLVNWGFVVSREYLFGDTTLLSGPTGVGKSSFQDAIQLVMTGAKQHINVFNSAQDEAGGGGRAGGKVRRTLASYAIGMRDNLCARPFGSHTYVAAVFAPEADEAAEAFTAVVAVEAQVAGAREQGRNVELSRKLYLILPGTRLAETDFIASRQGSAIISVPVDEIYVRLRQRYPKVLHFENSIEDYLCKLYAQFRGGSGTVVGPREAEAAARAFVQSIARKTVGSVDELIREQVLAEPDFSEQIGHISSLVQNVQRLRRIAAALLASRQRLAAVKEHADAFLAAFEEALEAELGEALRRKFDVERKIAGLTETKRQAELEAEREKASSDRHGEALARATQLLATAHGRLNGNPVAQERKRIDAEIESAERKRSETAVALLGALDDLRITLGELAGLSNEPNREESAYKAALDQLVLDLGGIDIAGAQAAAGSLAARLAADSIDLAGLPRDRFAVLDKQLAPLMERLHGADGLYALVARERGRLEDKASGLQREIEETVKRRQGLEDGRMDLPKPVEVAVDYLESRYPGARPRVLCNLVQPRGGSRWQNAIEGLLGGNRFVILVEAEFEARAIQAVRHDLRGHFSEHGASVVQGELAGRRAASQALPPDSILHELAIADETAKAYLVAGYGRYVKVGDAEALRNVAQGLTVDGMASGGFKMFTAWIGDGELAFGIEARRKRAVKLARDIDEKRREIGDLKTKAGALAAWSERLRRLDAPSIAPRLDALAEAQRFLNSVVAERAGLDDSGIKGLERRVVRAQHLFDGHRNLLGRAERAAGEAEGRAKGLESNIAEAEADLATRKEAVRRVRLRLAEAVRLNARFNPAQLEHRAEAAVAEQTAEQFGGRRSRQTGLYREQREAFERQVEEHNRLASSLDEKVDYQPRESCEGEHEWQAYGGVPEARGRIAAMLDRLDRVRILNNDKELAEAERNFNNTFSTHFALAVRTSVERGIQPLKRLNDKLRRLAFGEDRFEIEFGQMVKEYKRYYELFEELNRLAETQIPVDLFSAAEGALSADGAAALEDIRKLLLDPNREYALRRLKDIADYRNYRQYDIRKYSEDGREASLARMATFSGGELMTPAYLVRAAVLAQAFRQLENSASLKLMMIDEAFDKMDEARTAAVMRYLNENLGLQLIVAMPSRASGPLLDLFTFEHRFSLMKVEGLAGELDKVTEVDSSMLKTDRLRLLWEQRRAAVRAEAEQAFLQQEARQAAAGGLPS